MNLLDNLESLNLLNGPTSPLNSTDLCSLYFLVIEKRFTRTGQSLLLFFFKIRTIFVFDVL